MYDNESWQERQHQECRVQGKTRTDNSCEQLIFIIFCPIQVLHVTGHIAFKDDGYRQLIAIARPLPNPVNIQVPLGSSVFLTKHSLDMKFTYVDDKCVFWNSVWKFNGILIVGQSPLLILGCSGWWATNPTTFWASHCTSSTMAATRTAWWHHSRVVSVIFNYFDPLQRVVFVRGKFSFEINREFMPKLLLSPQK